MGGQHLFEILSVLFIGHAGIHDQHDAAVAFAADESAEALAQFEQGVGQHKVHEGIFLFAVEFVDQGFHDGLGRHEEGEFEEDEQRQRFPLDIHPLPKGIGTQQDRVGVALEFLEHGAAAGRLALREEGAFTVVEVLADVVVNAVQVTVAGEQDHGADVCAGQELFHTAQGLVDEKTVLMLGQETPHHQPRLGLVIEGGIDDGGGDLFRRHQAQPALAKEILERASQSKGGRCEYDAGNDFVEHSVELPGNIDRRVAERGDGIPAFRTQRVFDPERVVFQIGVGEVEQAGFRFQRPHHKGI